MDKVKAGTFFFRELSKVRAGVGDSRTRLTNLSELLVNVCYTSIRDTGIQFHTVFSIIAYTGHRYHLPGKLLYHVHKFRREVNQMALRERIEDAEADALSALGYKVIADLIRFIFGVIPAPDILAWLPSGKLYTYATQEVATFRKHQRVLILERKEDRDILIAADQQEGGKEVHIRYNVEGRNENFNDSVALLGAAIPFPAEVNLIDVEEDTEGVLWPKAFVLEPDFLMDITSVADCFSGRHIHEIAYLNRKFFPVPANKHLMLGNIANFFLDELMSNPDQTFDELIRRVFPLNPLAFALFDDATSREIVMAARKHYRSLKTVLRQTFPKEGIQLRYCFLEPTFYSQHYGLQGRLDVLHDNPEVDDDASIIELKSGNPYRPNMYGLSHSHYIQTLLYDLLIKSVSEDRLKPTNYILYTVKDSDHLRFAPAVRSQQYEALAARNRLIALDQRFCRLDALLDTPDRFLAMFEEQSQLVQGFSKRDFEVLVQRFRALSILEQKYFLAMSAMTAREHRLAKLGLEGNNHNHGQAALWLNAQFEKEQQYAILSHLKLTENKTREQDPVLIFNRTDQSNPLANFRQGDLALVYPCTEADQPLTHQLFKGVIVVYDQEQIHVRLRAKQFNDSIFKAHAFWNIEHDVLDSSFSGLYRSLFAFTGFPASARRKFMTLKAPAQPEPHPWKPVPVMTSEQNRIMEKMLSARDYFLLWGPPGTGKTSIMLRYLVDHLLRRTAEHVLILAYTNRAVDEICMALSALPQKPDFIRIGSRYATHPDFVSHLLSHRVESISQRSEMRNLIASQRLIVGTIASVQGKPELFELKQFDRVIIDEATQVLEPVLAGLIPRFNQVLLIGDHKQLPAVVTQPSAQRKVEDDTLLSVGLKDLGNSYFERVYERCIQEGWDWAYDRLKQQGRMHRDIMEFPSSKFYQGMLETLPEDTPTGQEQLRPLAFDPPSDPIGQVLATQRVAFFPVWSEETYVNKTNAAEARLVAQLIQSFVALYKENEDFDLADIGVITPFRAQIALIRETLARQDISPDDLTIDTVERYQGGARKIIIVSLCIHASHQLEQLISQSDQGVDRKLNVALTRARDHLVVVGNPDVLSENEIYADFMDRYRCSQTVTI